MITSNRDLSSENVTPPTPSINFNYFNYGSSNAEINNLIADLIRRGSITSRNKTIEVLRNKGVALYPPSIDQIKALYDYVKDDIDYIRDIKRIETLSSADVMFEIKAGDCDDKVILLGSMLRSIGYDIFIVLAQISDPIDFDHIYLWVVFPHRTNDPIVQIKNYNAKEFVPVIALDTTYISAPIGSEVPIIKKKKAIYLI